MSSSSSSPSLVPVIPFVQQYDWGASTKDTSAIQALIAHRNDIQYDANKPLAEMWMGTHQNGKNYVLVNGDRVLLRDYLGHDLPFLFKVLCARKALSIQSHPHKSLAEQLHKEKPNLYTDPNHKPELAVALGPFAVLCGFRPYDEIVGHISSCPELQTLLGVDVSRGSLSQSEHLARMFSVVMRAQTSLFVPLLNTMLTRLGAHHRALNFAEFAHHNSAQLQQHQAVDLPLAPLLLELAQQFPNDIGIFAPFFLNAFLLPSNSYIFQRPNMPHAYLNGDCLEAMANSDNVMRVGLTPKHRDVEALLNSLEYVSNTVQEMAMQPTHHGVYIYKPPSQFPEFQLNQAHVSSSSSLPSSSDASILLVLSGQAQLTVDGVTLATKKGDVWLLSKDKQVAIVNTNDKETFTIIQATTNQ